MNQDEHQKYLAALEALNFAAQNNERLSEKLLEAFETLEDNQKLLANQLRQLREKGEQ
jgi:hypothetical protein